MSFPSLPAHPSLTFSLLQLSAHFPCQRVCALTGTHRTASELRPSSLFMGAENYNVTFPAFLLEFSNRSGLSVQDRNPESGETGCCCIRFLSHHFLQVDKRKPLVYIYQPGGNDGILYPLHNMSTYTYFNAMCRQVQ